MVSVSRLARWLLVTGGLALSLGAPAEPTAEVVLRLEFERPGEPGYRLQHGAAVRADVAIAGKGALWCDTTGSEGEWHEFLHTDREVARLAANATYRVSWDYRLVSLAEDANLYFLARSASKPISEDCGWVPWRAAPGAYSHRETTFTLGPHDDYYLIFGVRRRGAVAIDNVVVRQVTPPPALAEPPARKLVMITSMDPPGGIYERGEAVTVRAQAMSVAEAVAFGTLAPYQEEHQANGEVWAAHVSGTSAEDSGAATRAAPPSSAHESPAPRGGRHQDEASGVPVVKLVFEIKRDDVTDWIDWNSGWHPPLDLSGAEEAVVEVMSERAGSGPVIKIMAGAQVVAEQRIAPDAAGQWQTFRVPLRGDRERVTMIGFYLPCRGGIAAGERVTYHLRGLRFEPEPASWTVARDPVRVTGRLVDFHGIPVPMADGQERGGDPSRRGAVLRMTDGEAEISTRGLPAGYYEAHFEAQVGKETQTAKASLAVMPTAPAVDADEPFGINHGRQYPELAARAGIAWDRFNLGWRWVEIEPDRWREDAYDEAIARSHRAGVNLLGLLAGAPEWRQDIVPGVERRAHDFYWRTFAPKDPAAFGEFVFRMVRRYRGQIRHWEIWNEPQVTEIFFYGGTPERYVAMLKEAYRRAKEADPGCVVVGMGGVGPDYLEKCLALGAAEFMDAVSIHSYMSGTAPEGGRLVSDIVRTRELLERAGKPMPIWLTEIGWPTSATESRGWRPSSEAEQAQYLARSFLLAMSNGVEKYFFYMLFDSGTDPTEFEHNQGLVRHDLTPKPSYVAYANLIRVLPGRRFTRRLEVHPAVYAFVFEGEDRATIALWSLAEGLTMSVEGPPEGTAITGMMGGRFDVADGIGIGDGPIYIEVPRAALAALTESLRNAKWSACAPTAVAEARAVYLDRNAAIVHATLRGALVEPASVQVEMEAPGGVEALPREGITVPLAAGEQVDIGFLLRWPAGRKPEAVKIRTSGGGMRGMASVRLAE